MVKRAMNRPPSSKDPWWDKHQETCGGTYIKIKEPDGYKKKGKTNEAENSKTMQDKSTNIKKLLEKNGNNSSVPTLKQSPQRTPEFSGTGHTLGGMKQEHSNKVLKPSEAAAIAAQKRHSQPTDSPVSKRIKESSKDKKWSKQVAKADKSSASPSKPTTASKDIRVLFSTGTKHGKASGITNDMPCSSSSILKQEQCNEEVIDLTDDDTCPICGFTSPNADLLSIHVNECLDRFAS